MDANFSETVCFFFQELWHHLKQKMPSKNNAKALIVESYPISEDLLPLHNRQVEDHFKVYPKNRTIV